MKGVDENDDATNKTCQTQNHRQQQKDDCHDISSLVTTPSLSTRTEGAKKKSRTTKSQSRHHNDEQPHTSKHTKRQYNRHVEWIKPPAVAGNLVPEPLSHCLGNNEQQGVGNEKCIDQRPKGMRTPRVFELKMRDAGDTAGQSTAGTGQFKAPTKPTHRDLESIYRQEDRQRKRQQSAASCQRTENDVGQIVTFARHSRCGQTMIIQEVCRHVTFFTCELVIESQAAFP